MFRGANGDTSRGIRIREVYALYEDMGKVSYEDLPKRYPEILVYWNAAGMIGEACGSASNRSACQSIQLISIICGTLRAGIYVASVQ